MTNAYIPLDVFKASGILGITGTTDNTRILQLIEDVSRQMDKFCQRHFYSLTGVKYFQGRRTNRSAYRDGIVFNGQRLPYWFGVGIGASKRVLLPEDLIAITTLKEDTQADGTWGTTWASTDYLLWPYDADPTGGHDSSRPYSFIEVNERRDGDYYVFLYTQQAYEVTGRWGYWEQTTDTGITVNETYTATDTTLTVSAGTTLYVGETFLIDSEQIYCTAKTVNDLTVVRGVNGTTAAAHASGTEIYRYSYPGTIVEACAMQAARLWTRRQSGFANTVGFTETGQLTPMTGLDKDVKDMLMPLRKLKAHMRVL